MGGSSIANGTELGFKIKKRVEGKQLSLTVKNADGKRRVVYVVLGNILL